jgi:hypothetical protein
MERIAGRAGMMRSMIRRDHRLPGRVARSLVERLRLTSSRNN